MSRAPEPYTPEHRAGDVPSALAEYADRLLLGTGLEVLDALRIASGELDSPAPLKGLAQALRAGWQLEEELA